MRSVVPDPARDAIIAQNNALAGHAKSINSQHGEDGVIAEILRRLGISQGWCVEFGAWDGKHHSNTWTLIHERGWKAVLIEPSAAPFAALAMNCSGLADVYCFNSFVTSSGDTTLDAILSRTPIPTDFDLLIVDIDGNDFYVWQACEKYAPKIVMIEFSPFIPADIFYVKPEALEERASASLRAICELAKRKGYELVCVLSDGNAIFVRARDFPRFGIADNRPTAMFRCTVETKIFQGYDGTLMLAGNRKLNWRWFVDREGRIGNVEMTDEDVQVLPASLRVFRPRLSCRNAFLEEHAGKIDRTRVPANRLLEFQRNTTSECGEDGVLAEIFSRLGIDAGYCVEVGAYDGKTFSNTWSLIHERRWRGLMIEKDAAAFASLRALYGANPSVQTHHAEVASRGKYSLDALLKEARAPRQFEFLCIDVEGNDFHLWASLSDFAATVVMVDFNPSIPNDVVFAQEDSAAINHGSSLRAFIELAANKGYELAAVTSWNAIFVRREHLARLGVTDNGIDRMYYPVFETRVFQSMNHSLTVIGCTRLMRHDYGFEPEQLQPLPANIRAIPYFTTDENERRNTLGLYLQLEHADHVS